MNLLFVSQYFPQTERSDYKGGVEARLVELIRGLSANNHVTVLTSSTVGSKKQILYGAHIFRCGPKLNYNLRASFLNRLFFVFSACWESRKFSFDLVEGTDFVTHLAAWIIGTFKKIPTVAWYPDVFLGTWTKNMGLFYGSIGYLLEKFNISHRWSAVITISNATKEKLVAAGFPKRKIKVVYCGIDQDLVKNLPAKKYTQTIVCAGRFVDYKRFDLALEIFAKMSLINEKVRLILIGSGPEEGNLRNLASKLGVADKVKFTGFIKDHRDVLKLINDAFVFLHTSSVEGFGIVILEAMACGTPYVSTDVEAVSEITEGGKGGFLVGDQEPETYLEKIVELFSKTTLYARKSAEGRKLSLNYSWERLARETEKIYRRLAV